MRIRLGDRRWARLQWCVVVAVTVLVASPSPLRAAGASAGRGGVVFRLEGSLRDPHPGPPATGEVFNEFGQSVASAGSTVVVGAPGERDFTGAAYAFARNEGVWRLQKRLSLTASDARLSAGGAEFGASVATSGRTIVVGGVGVFSALHPQDQGQVDVFVHRGGTWRRSARLFASDEQNHSDFGTDVAISGGTIVATAFDGGGLGETSAAYVFTRHGGRWAQTAEFTFPAPAQFNGCAAAVSGSTILVATADAVHVYVRSGETWVLQATIHDPAPAAGDNFGGSLNGPSLAIAGNTALIGAAPTPSLFAGQGRAYVFHRDGAAWSLQAALTGPIAGQDGFGMSVGLSGPTAFVSAPLNPRAALGSPRGSVGTVYVFANHAGAWRRVGSLSQPRHTRVFTTLSATPATMFVGTTNLKDGGRGRVLVYRWTG